MRKLFTLLTVALFATSLWAADPTLSFGTTAATSSTFLKTYATEGITISSDQEYQSSAVQIGTVASAYNANYLEVLSSNRAIDSIQVLISGNGSNKKIQSPMFGWATTANGNTANTYDIPDEQTTTGNGYSYAKWFKYDLSKVSVKCARIYKQTKNISSTNPAYTGSSTGLGSGQTIKVYGMKIWLHPAAYTVTYKAGEGTGDDVVDDQATSVAGCPNTFTAPDGKAFSGWKNANNEDVAVGATVSANMTLTAQWAQLYTVTYNANGATGNVPTEDSHIAGAKFEISDQGSLETPANKAFGGWSYNESTYAAGAEFTMPAANVTFTAIWVNTYTVTYKANNGTAEADSVANSPATIATNTFFTAPAQKAFKEWNTQANGKGSSYAPGEAVSTTLTLYAIWKGVPQTIFHWQSNSSSRDTNSQNGTTTGGSVTLRSTDTNSWQEESATYHSSVANDMKCLTEGKELKPKGNAQYLELTLTSGTFQEGDTIFVTGYYPWIFGTTTDFSQFDVADTIKTGSSKTDVRTGYAVIKSGIDAATIYARRGLGSSTGIAAIKVIRPAAKDTVSKVITLSDVKVNDNSLSSDSLATLISAHSLELKDSYVDAPVIKFNEHTVITFTEGDPKVKDKVYTVTATVNGAGKWEAKQTINSVEYTVTAVKMTSYTVTYKYGEDTLHTETVAENGHPAEYNTAKNKVPCTSLDGWYSKSDLTGDAVVIAEAVITKDTTFYGKFTYEYATSINIEQLVWDNGKGYDLVSNLGTLHYATNWTNDLDSLGSVADKGRNRNYAYLGQKVKATGKMIDFRLAEGSTVKVKFGNAPADIKVFINGKDSTVAKANLSSPFTYTATEDSYLSIRSTTDGTLVFKQIMINEDIKDVVYTINCTAAEHGKDSCSWALAFPGEKVTLIAIADKGYKLEAFTVCKTGDPETTVTVTDSAFTMPAYAVTVSATFVEDSGSGIDEVETANKAVKFFENGQMYIRRGEKVYTVTGAEVK